MSVVKSGIRVTRDGVVMRDGINIGHVVKEMRQGIFATLFGASVATGDGTPYWVPFDAEGNQLSEYGYDTRKRSVELIDRVSRPTEVTDIRLEYGIGSYSRCVSAGLRVKGFYFGVSRYAHEDHWVVDFLSRPESIMPTFSNGTGSRVTAAKVLSDEMSALVTDAAIAAGIWPITGESE